MTLPASTPKPANLRPLQAKIARSVRLGDQAAETEARRTYAVAKLDDYIQRVIDAAPPLTQEQAERLAALLLGGAA